MSFSSYRNPEWGDFYAKDGNYGQTGTCQAWNYGFTLEDPTDPIQDGSIDYHIVRPNEDYIPEVGTWLLLGCTGIFGAVVRRRKK